MEKNQGSFEQKSEQEVLQYQLNFEKMVAEISSNFISKPTEEVDDAIDFALRRSGQFFKAERSFVFSFSDNYEKMTNTHEWCAPEVRSQRNRNQNYHVDQERWWLQETLKGNPVNVPDVEELPEDMESDKVEFRAENISSFVTIPLIREGRVFGYFGFDGVKELKSWSEDQMSLLKVIGEIITAAIVKNETEEELKESEKRYREILNTMEEGYYEIGLDGKINYCNFAASRILGYSKSALIGMHYKEVCVDPDAAYQAFNKVYLTEQVERRLVLKLLRRDNSELYCELSISLQKDNEGKPSGFTGIGRDVTERIEYEKRLEHISMHDQLTGIYNRAYFEVEIERLNKSRAYPISIISADLDGLKLINDTMGHEAGDKLLLSCAELIKNSLRRSDILARVGGDEFAALLTWADEETARSIVRRIRENLSTYNLRNKDLPLSISLGVATADKNTVDLHKVLKQADDMMYREKLYTSSSSSRSKIVQSLMAALAERDYITEGHAQRLEKLCMAVGERVNLSKRQLSDLALLAKVHDLGKVGIPDQILFKQDTLTHSEWEVMRSHPEKGYRIALSSPDLASVADLILKHHERWDGKGYPLGLKGDKIPVECRILAIVDAYDAITNKRPYSKARPTREALKEITKNAGSQFDPELTAVFLEALKEMHPENRKMANLFLAKSDK